MEKFSIPKKLLSKVLKYCQKVLLLPPDPNKSVDCGEKQFDYNYRLCRFYGPPCRKIAFPLCFFRLTRQTTKYLLCIILSDTALIASNTSIHRQRGAAAASTAKGEKPANWPRFIDQMPSAIMQVLLCANGKLVRKKKLFETFSKTEIVCIKNRWNVY